MRGEYDGIGYGLHGLPTVTDLQAAIAALEGGHAALAVPSGLTATTLPLLALANPGDHVLVTDSVYGPTRRFCELHLKRLGVEVSFYDPLLGADIAREFRPNTRIVFVESPGSLTFDVQDVPAIAKVAHSRNALVIMDNSWATPLNFRAFDFGVDVSVHAATKYIGGHSDVLLGLIVCSEATFPRLHRLWTDMGVTASSDDCFLGLRGLRTLATRLARQQASGIKVAEWLRTRPEVNEVIHPALPGSRGHELWKRDFAGATSLFGVVLNPVSKARIDAMLDGMQPLRHGLELGRVRKPDHSDLSGTRPHGIAMEGRRTVAAPLRRPRGSGRPDRRSRRGSCTPGRSGFLAQIDGLHARIGADRVRRALRDDAAAVQHDHAVRETEHHVHVVFGEQHGDAVAFGER